MSKQDEIEQLSADIIAWVTSHIVTARDQKDTVESVGLEYAELIKRISTEIEKLFEVEGKRKVVCKLQYFNTDIKRWYDDALPGDSKKAILRIKKRQKLRHPSTSFRAIKRTTTDEIIEG